MKNETNTAAASTSHLTEKMRDWSLSHASEAKGRRAVLHLERIQRQTKQKADRQQERERRKIAWVVGRLLKHVRAITGEDGVRAMTLVREHLAQLDQNVKGKSRD